MCKSMNYIVFHISYIYTAIFWKLVKFFKKLPTVVKLEKPRSLCQLCVTHYMHYLLFFRILQKDGFICQLQWTHQHTLLCTKTWCGRHCRSPVGWARQQRTEHRDFPREEHSSGYREWFKSNQSAENEGHPKQLRSPGQLVPSSPKQTNKHQRTSIGGIWLAGPCREALCQVQHEGTISRSRWSRHWEPPCRPAPL